MGVTWPILTLIMDAWFLDTIMLWIAFHWIHDRDHPLTQALRTVHYELHYVIPVLLVIAVLLDPDAGVGDLLFGLMGWICACWGTHLDDHDDRWRRRLERGAGWVRRQFSRLVVVPE